MARLSSVSPEFLCATKCLGLDFAMTLYFACYSESGNFSRLPGPTVYIPVTLSFSVSSLPQPVTRSGINMIAVANNIHKYFFTCFAPLLVSWRLYRQVCDFILYKPVEFFKITGHLLQDVADTIVCEQILTAD